MKMSREEFVNFLELNRYVRVDRSSDNRCIMFFSRTRPDDPCTYGDGSIIHETNDFTIVTDLLPSYDDRRNTFNIELMHWMGITHLCTPGPDFLKGREGELYDTIVRLEGLFELF